MKLTGVQLGLKQRAMVEARLQKRVHDLGYRNIDEYQTYYEAHENDEIQYIVSLLTTHYTYFFREFSHFEYISEKILPDLVPEVLKRPDRTLRIWSAAASRGQEVYSLAMYLNHHLKKYGENIKVSILGTDVDSQSVRVGQNGVYPRREIREVPLTYLGNHWSRGTGEIADFVKAKDSLRQMVRFEQSNLLDLKDKFVGQTFDIIFCRNVFIYFTPEQIRSSTQMLLKHLQPKGDLFIGLSESLNGLGFDLKSQGPSVYRFPDASPAVVSVVPSTQMSARIAITPIRVLCVDDSPSIHSLMKQILKRENGFEIVGTAMNGLEASQKLKMLKVDVMTLDIHMPEQGGIEYLEKNFGPDHPPVVMVSSVSRDQSDLSLKSLKLGATDYVEKPALNALQERGEELRAKLKTAVISKNQVTRSLGLDEQFKKRLEISVPENKVRVLASGFAHLKKTAQFLKELDGVQPPIYLLFEGVAASLPTIAQELKFMSGKGVTFMEAAPRKAKPGEIWIMDFKNAIQHLSDSPTHERLSVAVMGEWGKGSSEMIKSLKPGQLLLEDLGSGKGAEFLQTAANDIFPSSSFSFLGTEYLGKK